MLALALAGTAHAATNTVTSLADSGIGSLRQVMANSAAGDSIVFGVTGTISLYSGELVVANNLTIIGPGSSTLAISGEGNSRIFNITSNVTALISGLAVINGQSGPAQPGGGIYNAGDLSVTHCAIRSNRSGNGVTSSNAGGWGGGIYSVGPLRLDHSIISDNTAGTGADGGNFHIYGGGGGVGGYGGGIFSWGAMALTDCTVSNNVCGSGGSGGFGQVGGGSGGSGGYGGGVFAQNSLLLVGCTIVSNRSGLGGGGGSSSASPASGGWGGFGGGICSQGLLLLTNCTIAGNSCGSGGVGGFMTSPPYGQAGGGPAGYGGGASVSGTNQTMVACTIVNNAVGLVDGQGGGVYSARAGAPGGFQNTIVARNAGQAPDVAGIFNSLGHNLIGVTNGSSGFTAPGDLAGSSASPFEPKLAPLADNGGPTLTMALRPGSPAIDAGDTASSPPTDQRGRPRPVGPAADIGAYEYGCTPRLSIDPPQAGGVQIHLCDLIGSSCRLLASTNLTDWLPMATNQIRSDGTAQFEIPPAPSDQHRFYRVAFP